MAHSALVTYSTVFCDPPKFILLHIPSDMPQGMIWAWYDMGMLSKFTEKLDKDSNSGLSIFIENTVLELKAYILDKRMKIQSHLITQTEL